VLDVSAMTDTNLTMSVAQLGARVGLRPDTIRYYERSGLIPPAPRTTGDHRRYGEDAVDPSASSKARSG